MTVSQQIIQILEDKYCKDGLTRTISFLPHLSQMSDSLRPVFEAAKASDKFYALWCPMDLYPREYGGRTLKTPIEAHNDFGVIASDKILDHYPDIVVIEYPYDNGNRATDIPRELCTDRLKAAGAEIVYIPYFCGEAGEGTRYAPGMRNVDVIFAYNDKDKVRYTVAYPYKDIYAVGSPKEDWLVRLSDFDFDALIVNSIHPYLENPKGRTDKYQQIIERLEGKRICFRPHPLMRQGIKALRPECEDYWEDFLGWVQDRAEIITEGSITDQINRSLELFSDPSSVIDLWQQTGREYHIIETEQDVK